MQTQSFNRLLYNKQVKLADILNKPLWLAAFVTKPSTKYGGSMYFICFLIDQSNGDMFITTLGGNAVAEKLEELSTLRPDRAISLKFVKTMSQSGSYYNDAVLLEPEHIAQLYKITQEHLFDIDKLPTSDEEAANASK